MTARRYRMTARINRMLPMSAPSLIDALAPLLEVRPEIDDVCRFGSVFRSEHRGAGANAAYFHLVLSGACRLIRHGEPEVRLAAGDMLLLPQGDRHATIGLENGESDIETDHQYGLRLRQTVGGGTTELVCGRLLYRPGDDALLAVLPPTIVARAGSPEGAIAQGLMQQIRDELAAPRPGSKPVVTHLASALMVMVLRDHLTHAEHATLPALLADRSTARVVMALLREPARDWTLEEMADIANMARASLVRAFGKACGKPPMAFLTDLRLNLARQRLTATDEPIASIALAVGYQSESALSRAFLRQFGERPGAYRGDLT